MSAEIGVDQMSGFIKLNNVTPIDAFFLNEDRHMHNIAVLMDSDSKEYQRNLRNP